MVHSTLQFFFELSEHFIPLAKNPVVALYRHLRVHVDKVVVDAIDEGFDAVFMDPAMILIMLGEVAQAAASLCPGADLFEIHHDRL